MFSEFPATSKSDPFPRSCTTITTYPYLPSGPFRDAKPSHERCEKKQCHPLLLPRRTLAVHHGHYDPHQVRTLDVMGLETPGHGSRDGAAQLFAKGAAQCSICIILPQACPKMDNFLYFFCIYWWYHPKNDGTACLGWMFHQFGHLCQHGNVHHKLQYIAAHLQPLFRTYDLKLSRSHQ